MPVAPAGRAVLSPHGTADGPPASTTRIHARLGHVAREPVRPAHPRRARRAGDRRLERRRLLGVRAPPPGPPRRRTGTARHSPLGDAQRQRPAHARGRGARGPHGLRAPRRSQRRVDPQERVLQDVVGKTQAAGKCVGLSYDSDAMRPEERAARAAAYERARPEILVHVPAQAPARARPRLRDRHYRRRAEGAAARATSRAIEIEPEYAREAASVTRPRDRRPTRRRPPGRRPVRRADRGRHPRAPDRPVGDACGVRRAVDAGRDRRRQPPERRATGARTRTWPAAPGRARPRASSTPPTCAGSRCATPRRSSAQAGLRAAHGRRAGAGC